MLSFYTILSAENAVSRRAYNVEGHALVCTNLSKDWYVDGNMFFEMLWMVYMFQTVINFVEKSNKIYLNAVFSR